MPRVGILGNIFLQFQGKGLQRKEVIKRNCTYRQCNYLKEADCVADCYSESGKTFVHKKEKNENEKKKKIVPQWDF